MDPAGKDGPESGEELRAGTVAELLCLCHWTELVDFAFCFPLQIQLWDTAGQERFRTITST